MKKPTKPLPLGEQAQADYEQKVAERNKPNRTPDQLTVDIIDGINTFCQLLRGRDLSAPAVLDALEDLVDNGEVGKLFLEIFKNEHGRRSVKV